jgi:hypothetical protein
MLEWIIRILVVAFGLLIGFLVGLYWMTGAF